MSLLQLLITIFFHINYCTNIELYSNLYKYITLTNTENFELTSSHNDNIRRVLSKDWNQEKHRHEDCLILKILKTIKYIDERTIMIICRCLNQLTSSVTWPAFICNSCNSVLGTPPFSAGGAASAAAVPEGILKTITKSNQNFSH